MTLVAHDRLSLPHSSALARRRREVRVALFGLGRVGSAVARRALTLSDSAGCDVRIAGALVRQPGTRSPQVPVTADGRSLLDAAPDAVIEVLGGIEPARTLVLDALGRGIPVITANKSLLAAHGCELIEAAGEAGVPLRFEASVLAGVPFLGTFARRPLAAAITRITGIVNGTTNFILSEIGRGESYTAALRDARRLGFAESNPASDVDGIDAAEKLAILVGQFAQLHVRPCDIPTTGIQSITAADLIHAKAMGGTIKPIAAADWTNEEPAAYVGPAYVPAGHPLATVSGVLNGVCLETEASAPLFFSGPGAGPDVTALTILDDLIETIADTNHQHCITYMRRAPVQRWSHASWFVRLASQTRLPDGGDIADLLGAHGVWLQRASDTDERSGHHQRWLHTYPCAVRCIETGLLALTRATGCTTAVIPVLETPHV